MTHHLPPSAVRTDTTSPSARADQERAADLLAARGRLGVVIIGRNEGARLRRSLESLPAGVAQAVYVDSGSTDGSLALAESFGVDVVALNPTLPFTAGRARNVGFFHLCDADPTIEYVQFLDGDCALSPEWLDIASATLVKNGQLAAVGGRLRELERERSVYNMLCDAEWNTPVGAARHFGGNMLVRVEAFRRAEGFLPTLIAGEECELCVRWRAAGWQLERLDVDMGWHDASMTCFRQWWRRAYRAGHAFAQGVAMHGRTRERHFVRESLSTWAWALGVPLLALVAIPWTSGWSLLILIAGPIALVAKIFRNLRGRSESPRERWQIAGFTALAKIPQWLGQLRFLRDHWLHRPSELIEYKGPQV